ncbi:hypothetical protein HX92_4125 [Mycobacterium tuberculosis]|nr:hypothetical protein MTBK_41030 [Mycobacterium tuberculosis K]ALB21139.1 Hypothetical protein AFL40_4039 [Mycobacterium tuberculosis]ANZ84659.1 Hypothetical protein BEE65_4056 [Mycobacterium tuberculosis]AOE38360.1 Hypothetical protein BEE64_4053 [Mycobacterium tuberculosis]AOZ45296.1 hypothetical protein BTB1458_4300 [Mycobacterium tuberculosis]
MTTRLIAQAVHHARGFNGLLRIPARGGSSGRAGVKCRRPTGW